MFDETKANKAMHLIPKSIIKLAHHVARADVIVTIADIRDITDWLEINGMENVLSIPSEDRIKYVAELIEYEVIHV